MPDARNRRGQRYCREGVCRKASKAESQRRWLKQEANREYFSGDENAARVRAWQAAHPGYWKHRRKRGPCVLQDLLIGQVAEVQREARQDGVSVLQDHWQTQAPVVIGLIAHLAGTVLQEDIASMTGRLIAKGQALMSRNDAPKTDIARGPAATGADGI
jgi:hypothetical protein